MGIISVYEKLDGTRSTSINNTFTRTYTRTFIVETTGPEVGPLAVRTAGGIPQVGTTYDNGLINTDPDYEVDFGAFVQSIEAQMDGASGGIQWNVTVQYGAYDAQTFGNDPTAWPLKVAHGGERTERVIYFDKNGDRVANSAGDPFDPPITVDDHRVTLSVTRNELVSAFDPVLAGNPFHVASLIVSE